MVRTRAVVPATAVWSTVLLGLAMLPWFGGSSLRAQQPEDRPAPSRPAPTLDAALRTLAARLDLEGCGLAVGRGGDLLATTTTGEFAEGRVLPIASASKWLAVATILTLVDDGTLDLDTELGRLHPAFDRPDKRSLTLRQCLSCTAGFHASLPASRDPSLDMEGLARALADHPLQNDAGLEFVYSGLGFQAAACAAVHVTGKDWHTLFAARIGGPLGMRDTAFGRLAPIGDAAGSCAAPWVAGGAVSTLRDYERFTRMLADRGLFEGRRVLTAASVDRMFAVHTKGMTVRFAGFDGELAYGLGTWLQTLDDGLLRGSDPGAFGFLPWVDRDLGVYGVLALRDRIGRVLPRASAVQLAAREFAGSPSVAGHDERVDLDHGGRARRYFLHTPPGAAQAKALSLLLVLHGGGGNGQQVARSTGFSALADRESFVVAYPDGTGALPEKLLTWNAGGIPVYAQDHGVDDTGFLRAVVADIATRVAIDPDRISVTGMSNGGMMCHRLAREAADLFAAVVPVAGAMNWTTLDPRTPIDVMIVHGTADPSVRFAGGAPERRHGRAGDRVDASVADAIAYYRARNGLSGEPAVEVVGKVRIETWSRAVGDGAVRLCTAVIDGGGHEWPGARSLLGTHGDWSASAAIWAFVKDARRRR